MTGRILAFAVVVLGMPLPVLAQSAAPSGAASCSGCHAGSEQVATEIPSIRGRPARELTPMMEAFRTGERSATVMGRIAKGFSEEEMRAIAAWYETQK